MIALGSCRAASRTHLSSSCPAGETLADFPFLTLGNFTIAPLLQRDFDIFVEAVAMEIGSRYPETGERYAYEILAGSVRDHPVLADTSLCKIILCCYLAGQIQGFTVVTPKLGRRIKFGPTVVLPHARDLGIARLLRKVSEIHFRRHGFLYAYSTCREDNLPARAYVTRSGYRLVGSLYGQYSPCVSELVYAKQLLRTFNDSSHWGQSSLDAQAPDTFVLKLKRGGAAKIVLSSYTFSGIDALSSIDYAVSVAQKRGIRRVYMQVPSKKSGQDIAKRLGFEVESLGLPDERAQSGILIARILER